MECPFVVGQKVVCVDAEWRDPHPKQWPCPLRVGAVYSISDIGITKTNPYNGTSGHVIVRLAEVRNPMPEGRGDIGFAAARFRSLVTRKTDISLFEAMLHRSTKKVPA